MPAMPLDEQELTDRVRKALGGRDVEPVAPLTGGASSLTFSTTIVDSGEEVVVKACPPGLAPVRNRDMLRQARAQRALLGTPVPVPAVLAEDPGAPPEVPPFFVMARLPGICLELGFLPPEEFPPADHVRGRQLECARLMGELHQLDPAALGIDDEPETTLVAEVQRWTASLDVCEEDLRAGSEDVGARLLATVPEATPSRLLHGDFRTGNVLAAGDRVTSVIDWEIWCRGDRRVDLAWFLLFVEDERYPSPPGTPTVGELLDRYQVAAGTEVRDLDWFRALVRYKQFSAGAFITRNARRRGAPVTPVDNGDNWLLTSARTLLG
jgi:aminoglycoside phosphotransferase (APT) family kinase protein